MLTYFAGVAMGIAISILASHRAHAADSSACYNVNDPDARAYCIAKSRNEPAACYSIKRAELRSMCLAEVRR